VNSVFVATAIAIIAMMLTVWLISVRIKDASIVDITWGLGFVLVVWVARIHVGGSWNLRHTLVLGATTLWGLRLAGYLGWRNMGKGEDFRYKLMRKKHGDKFPMISLFTVFGVQGLLMFIVSLPTQIAQMNFSRDANNSGLDFFLVVGFVVWLIGLLFETIGDLQLVKFKANPANKGLVMDRGLWAWTRHPNYFGDSCVWWGIWLMAMSAPVAIFGILGPIVMTFLLVKVSGVPMLEHSMSKRRPGYADYVKRTSSFLPRPPKKG
jgi:steroid 5-alpha reductase family enzyme